MADGMGLAVSRREIRRVLDENRSCHGVREVFAIGLERIATRWLAISCAAEGMTLPAARSRA